MEGRALFCGGLLVSIERVEHLPQVTPLRTLQLPSAFDSSGNTSLGELCHAGTRTLEESRGPREGFFVYRFEYLTPSGLPRSRLGVVGRLHANPDSRQTVRLIQDAIPTSVEASVTRLSEGARQSEPVVVAFDDLNFELEKEIESSIPNGTPSHTEGGDKATGRHSFWHVPDERRIEGLRQFFAKRACLVIDGDTEFRAFRRLRDSGACPGDLHGMQTPSPLTLFVNLFDFGVQLASWPVVIRELSRFDVNEFVAALHPSFLTKTYAFGEKVNVLAAFEKFREELRLLGFTETAFGAIFKDIRQFFIFQLRNGASRDQLFLPDVTELERGFDSVLVHRAILNRYVTGESGEAEGCGIGFLRTHEECVQEVLSGDAAAAFFINPPNKRRLLQVAREGLRLPPGSVCLEPSLPPSLFE